jgi:hypothetical protein
MTIQEARAINEGLMKAIRDETATAISLGSESDLTFSYENGTKTCTTTGNVTSQETVSVTTNAALTMTDFEINKGAYSVTGELSSTHISYLSGLIPNGESRTEYTGEFTVTDGTETWDFRWPKLTREISFMNDDTLRARLSGSYIIEGVTYSYSQGQP